MASFAPALDATFVEWDDDKVIRDNPYIRGLTDEHINWMFTSYKMGHFHPLTWVSYAIDHAIGKARLDSLDETAKKRYVRGLDPKIFHLTNLLLHAGVAIGFYFLARLMLRIFLPPPPDREDWATPFCAAVAAIFFACHPLRVETVAWATERRDVLSSVFLIPCLLLYLRYTLSPRWDKAKISFYVGSVLLLTVSLMSKAWGMTLPAVMLVLDVYPLRRIGGKAGWSASRWVAILVEKIPFIALAIFFGYHASQAQRIALGTAKTLSEWSIIDRIMQSFYGLFFYTYKTWIPTNLSPLVEIPVNHNPFAVQYLLAAGIVLLAGVLLIKFRKRWPAGVVAAICYAGILSPVLGIHQSGPQLVADRYSYLACMPWAIIVGAALLWLARRKGTDQKTRVSFVAATGMTVALLGLFATLTWRQTQVWQDSQTLWTHVLKVYPDNVMAHTNLGKRLREQGDVAGAIAHYQAALAIKPDDYLLLNNLSFAITQDESRPVEERNEQAAKYSARAVELQPEHPDIRYTHGRNLLRIGKFEEGVKQIRIAITLKPKYVKGYRGLGEAYMNRGRKTGDASMLALAEKNFLKTLKLERELNPTSGRVIYALDRLARINEWMDKPDRAISFYQELLAIDPKNGPALRGISRVNKNRGRSR